MSAFEKWWLGPTGYALLGEESSGIEAAWNAALDEAAKVAEIQWGVALRPEELRAAILALKGGK